MKQEEYSAACAVSNAKYKKTQLHLQQALAARKDQISDLTKRYLEEKAALEKEVQKLRVQMAEATAEAAAEKAHLNEEYLASLRAEMEE